MYCRYYFNHIVVDFVTASCTCTTPPTGIGFFFLVAPPLLLLLLLLYISLEFTLRAR